MTQRTAKLKEEGLFKLKKIPVAGRCPVLRCSKPSKATGSCGLCHRHHQARWRWLNPKESSFATLRMHAKARNLAFTISFDYYVGMMDCAGAWDRGAEKRGDVVSLDRIDPTRGYEPSNLRVVTISENTAKGNRERHLDPVVQAILARKRAKVDENFEKLERRMMGAAERDGDCPF